MTAEDYFRLLQMHLAGGTCGQERILEASTVAQMQMDQTQGVPIALSPYEDGRRYGFAWWLSPQGQAADEVSVQGALGATPWIDRDHHFAAFLLTTRGLREATTLWSQLRAPLRQVFEACPAEP